MLEERKDEKREKRKGKWRNVVRKTVVSMRLYSLSSKECAGNSDD